MKLVAAVAHYREPAGFMDRLRASLTELVDDIVELEGRWHGMPGNAPAGWSSQVEKRAHLMSLAADADWVLVVDGDEYVAHADTDAVRVALAATTLSVAEVTVRNLNRPWPLSELAPQAFPARRLFRAGATVAGPAHDDYRLDGLRLAGAGPLEPAEQLTALLTVAHDNRNRGTERNAAAATYRHTRRRDRTEAAA